MPPTAQVVAEIIGREPTLELAKRARYRAMYVPYRIRDNHWIAKTVGRRCADLLSRHLGGLLLPLAKCSEIARIARDRAIRQAYREGRSIVALAKEHDMTDRNIRRIVQSVTVSEPPTAMGCGQSREERQHR